MKHVSKDKVIYSFSSKHKPAEYVKAGELLLLETEDALGGQIKSEKDVVEKLDWSKVDGATGPVYMEGAERGDTLVVEILEIKTAENGSILTVPQYGALRDMPFKAKVKMVSIKNGSIEYDGVRLKASPSIGTIGVAPEGQEVPSGSSGPHGGNMDVKDVTAGTRVYFPVFTDGALFAAGDLHAVQGDGELCVSAVEVEGQILLRFNVIKGRRPPWPILETKDYCAYIACGDTLDEATIQGAKATVKALMKAYGWPFERAYMFASLCGDIKVNQVVDLKKGVRVAIQKELISIENMLTETI
nr:acetamidase/formamidase family protein [Candidatus Njordarchaeum guaymaensis]